MSEQADSKDGGTFLTPTSAQEFFGLALSVIAVFALVQFGAPLIRQLDFLDPKIREVFIGTAFAAFPVIHRASNRLVTGFKTATPMRVSVTLPVLVPVRPDLSPWFVSGAFVAMLIFAWNQLVSFAGAMAIDTFAALAGVSEKTDAATANNAVISSLLVLSVPLTAVVSIFAGVLLYRNTRSHVILALAFAAVLYVLSNALVSSVLNPGYVHEQWVLATSEGAAGIGYLVLGMGLVAAVVFVFAGAGALGSYFSGESSLGKVMVAARRLTPAERDALAADITNRIEAALRAKAGS